MGKALILILYGMGWGYVIRAKHLDEKAATLARELWEGHVRTRVAIEMSEYDHQMAARFPDVVKLDIMPDENLRTPEAELHAAS